ncbi:hypothetical protein [Streptomyces lydicus]|uniref:hypothetical protein n=1 Tax=Streptomyces lydicus TaxID=47763 RepID=UPI0037945B84
MCTARACGTDRGGGTDWSLAVRRAAERATACAEPVRRTAQPRRDAPRGGDHRLSADEHHWTVDELIPPERIGWATSG